MKYARILAEFHGRVWALPEELLLSMQDLLTAQASGTKWSDEEIQNRIATANGIRGYEPREHLGGVRYSALGAGTASERRSGRTAGKVAVIPITGIISHRMNQVSQISGSGGTSIQMLQAQVREALRDGDCKAIVFDVDSPGGGADGVPELSSEIYEARRQKPIIAVCNAMACSAAYWLASAASQVVCTPSGQCGSIGVFIALQDVSKALDMEGVKITLIKAGKYKAEGHPAEPLSKEAYGAFQSQVDAMYGMFTASVARNRGTSQAAVRDGYGQGRSILATPAVSAGLADRVGTLDSVLQELGVGAARRPGVAMAAAVSRDLGAVRRRSIATTSDPFRALQSKIARKELAAECLLDAGRSPRAPVSGDRAAPTTMEEVLLRRRHLAATLGDHAETPEQSVARRRREFALLW
jgi:signal peptide peptidase SppA